MNWSIKREADKATGWNNVCIVNEKGLVVANVVMQIDDSEMQIARLIAAAPDLLAALEKAMRCYGVDMQPAHRDEFRAAIAKARG